MFFGSIPAVITPFKNKEVDYNSLDKIVNHLILNGSNGLVPCGTTGESPTLSHEEHKKIIEQTIKSSDIINIELLKKLKVTKQSLNRVLKDLIKLQAVFFSKDKQDTRVKHVFLSEKGKKIFEEIFSIQKKRIYSVLLKSRSEEVLNFDNVLKKITNE